MYYIHLKRGVTGYLSPFVLQLGLKLISNRLLLFAETWIKGTGWSTSRPTHYVTTIIQPFFKFFYYGTGWEGLGGLSLVTTFELRDLREFCHLFHPMALWQFLIFCHLYACFYCWQFLNKIRAQHGVTECKLLYEDKWIKRRYVDPRDWEGL